MNTATLEKTLWTIDPTHSEIQFKVKHLVISTVTGAFTSFTGNIENEGENFIGSQIKFDVDIDSITTGVVDRDNHLKSDDFFSADKFPKMTFNGKLEEKGKDLKAVGSLTIRDITKEVQFNVEFGGTMGDFYGNTKAGFEVSGIINRKEFGLKWDAVTEAGGIVVGDEIKLQLNLQFALNK